MRSHCSVLQDENILEICDTTMWTHLTLTTVHLEIVKMINFILCAFYYDTHTQKNKPEPKEAFPHSHLHSE